MLLCITVYGWLYWYYSFFQVLKFTNSKDADNRVANFSQQMLLDTVHYQLTFETYPNSGLYEASVQVDIRKESFQVFPEISRLNKYGDQPSCIKEIFPDLRKYCYCKIRWRKNSF